MFLTRISIRNLLFIIVLIVALPGIFVIVNSGIQQRLDDISDAKEATHKLSDSIANEQNNLISSTRQLFIALSQLPEINARDARKVQTLLTQIHSLSPQYVLIFIADASGDIWASSIPSKERISIADRRYFRNAMSSGILSSGEYAVGRTTKKATLNFGYPIKGSDGRIANVLCVGINLDYYRHILEANKLAAGASYALIDHNGIILSRALEPEKYVGKPSNPVIFKEMREGAEQESSIGASSAAGDHRVQTYRKLRLEGETEPYMYIRAGIPVREVMSQANISLAWNITIYSTFLLIACFLSWLISRRYIINRIQELNNSAQRLAEGDLSVRISQQNTGGELGQLSRSFDIMAQKLASREEALANSEKFLNTIINTEPDCVKLMDCDGNVQMINQAGLAMLEADSPEQVKGRSLLPMVLQPYHNPFISAVRNTLQGGSEKLLFEMEGFRGRRLWMESHMVPFRNEGTETVSVLAITRDVTEQRKAEEERQALTEQLSQSQKVESIGRLAGGIAHDLNNLLTPIIGYAGMLQKEFNESSRAAARLDNILQASEKARALIQQLLNFSRKQTLNMKVVDINPVILSFYDIIRSSVREDIRIRLNLSSKIISISADKNQLEQVIMNLVVNAQDSIAGHGLIVIETAEAYLDDSFVKVNKGARTGNYLMLTVSDNGHGMDRETQQQIFEPFFTTKGVGHGIGLGLSSVYGIVKQHGGDIRVYSEVGSGTTFKVYFPLVDDTPTVECAPEDPGVVINGRHSILLVEDNELVRDMTCDLLRDAGFHVIVARDPGHALQLSRSSSYDILLSDVIMPGMSGPELHGELVRQNAQLKVIYMSGYSNDVISRHGISDDAVTYIQKPFTNNDLLKKLSELLSD